MVPQTSSVKPKRAGERRARLIHLLPPAMAIALGILFSEIIILSRVLIEVTLPVTPLEEPPPTVSAPIALTNPAPYINSALIVMILVVGAVALFWLIKKLKKIASIMTVALFWLVGFLVSIIYVSLLFFILHIPTVGLAGIVTLSMIISVLTILGIGSKFDWIRLISHSYVSSAAGTLLAFVIPFWTFFVLVFIVSAYDTWAVFKGPLGKFHERDIELLKGLVLGFKGLYVGLGDLTFYSMLVAFMLHNIGFVEALMASIGVIIGFGLTIKVKSRVVPGLPASLIMGLLIGLATSIIL